MRGRTIQVLLPFLIMFIWGAALLLRPHERAQITNVVETYTKQEKTGQRSHHKKTVAYAVVEVEYRGETATVTVHDYVWDPLKPGDYVEITKSITGKIVEYNTTNAYKLMECGLLAGIMVLVMYRVIVKLRSNAPPQR